MKCMVCGGDVPSGVTTCPICGFSVQPTEASALAEPSKPVKPAPSEPTNGKYQLVGGNNETANPFGADPSNREARMAPLEESAAPVVTGFDPYMSPSGGVPGGGSGIPGGGGGMPPYGGPMAGDPAPITKKKNSLSIVVIIVAALLVALVVGWMLGIFRSRPEDGTYDFVRAEMNGISVTTEQLKNMGLNVDDFTIKIKGGKATMTFLNQKGTCDVEISGSTIRFYDSYREYSGNIDTDKGTISIEQNGTKLIFEK